MSKITKALLMTVMPILIVTAILILTHCVYTELSKNVFISALFSDKNIVTDLSREASDSQFHSDVPETIEYSNETIGAIDFASQWAEINVDGWSVKNIPVYFGDTADILTNGAGMWIGSYFCGQGRNCIVSGNVMTHFYEIENTTIGTLITVNTVYGAYEYEVCDKFVFSKSDIDILYDENGSDTLILHTSYPRSLGLYTGDERIALICTLKRGIIYKTAFESDN